VIAVKNGQCHVGLSDEELADLALAGEEGRAVKCSTRDLPLILARQAVAEGSHEAPIWGGENVLRLPFDLFLGCELRMNKLD